MMIPEEYKFRDACEVDIPTICELLAYMDNEHKRRQPDIFKECVPDDYVKTVTNDLFNQKYKHLYVYDFNGHVIAFLQISENHMVSPDALQNRNYVEISKIVVHPDYQKQGLGHSLLEKAERLALKNNFDYLDLQVWGTNPARSVYDDFGFQIKSTSMVKKIKQSAPPESNEPV